MKNGPGKKRFSFKKRILIFIGVLLAMITVILLIMAWPMIHPKTYSPAQVAADLDSLVVYIERVHPDPYRQLSKVEFYKAVEQAKQRLSAKGKVTQMEFYYEASRLAAMFKEGHLSVRSDVFIERNMKLFPYFTAFRLEPGTHRLFLKTDVEIAGHGFKAGDELQEINGKPVREIVEGALEGVSGESDGFRCALLDVFFYVPDPLNIWVSQNMPADVYRVKMRKSSGELMSLDVESVGLLKWFVMNKEQNVDESLQVKAPFESKMLNDSTLLFSFNECVTDGLKEFLSDMFAKAKADGVRYLIIDNRFNTGGTSEAGDELCRYLTDKPFSSVDKVMIRFSEPIRLLQREYLNGVIPPRDTLVTQLDDPACRQQPYGDDVRFDGKVFLLNSYLTFSAAADFASQFAYYKMGTIVGEETGGMTISSGDIITLLLPNTRLGLSLPFKLFYNIGADENAPVQGVKPDVEVPSSGALDMALDMIAKGK
ncbi:MAG: hypothetical protein IJG42_00095 [Muribaculaceae bacterium]|nr:hypothetical protein [Muribaculaceae bacterium]